MTPSLQKFYDNISMVSIPEGLHVGFRVYMAERDAVLRRMIPKPDTEQEIAFITMRLASHAADWLRAKKGEVSHA